MFVDLISYLLIETEVLFLGFIVITAMGDGKDDWRYETRLFVFSSKDAI